jgi:septal ring factor EnvC (AmiA/AmiB activator)
LFLSSEVFGAVSQTAPKTLAEKLAQIREQVSILEQGILQDSQSRQNMTLQIRKMRKLMTLQKQEQLLGQKRMAELEKTVAELDIRRSGLKDKMAQQRQNIRKFLMSIEASDREQVFNSVHSFHLPENEKLEAPRRRVLANMVDRGLKEIEILKVDLADAIQLENRIQEEQQQLAYLIHDLREQEGVLELNSQLQMDFLKKKKNDHHSQLENYRKLKNAEAQVEHLIHQFNARIELEKAIAISSQGEFTKMKGRLPLPIEGGKIASEFGRSFDPRSGLYIFKKGVEIVAAKQQVVRAISSGKIAYAGELPHYGQVVIVDHGEHFYSLCAHLGKVSKKASEIVMSGEVIGKTGDSSTPLYFEIRSRNVAVNPLQWLTN